jgi:hypothetical protein
VVVEGHEFSFLEFRRVAGAFDSPVRRPDR